MWILSKSNYTKVSLIFRVSFIILYSNIVLTNCIAQCNPPDQLPSYDCAGSALTCLEGACYETLNNPFNCCTGFCGAQTAVHNPQYFQFIPTCQDVEIHIHVNGCTAGNALQSAILGACPWTNSDVISCDPGTPVGGTIVLIASGLVVGQVYWLLIDGSSGATCEYTIEFTDCILQPGLDGDITDGEANPVSVCQGYNGLALEVSPPVGNAHGYYWVLEWSGDTVTSTLPEHTIDIPTDLPAGIYEICARAFSGCDTSDFELCFEVEVYEIPNEIKPAATFCPEQFPFNWGSVNISGPDEYFQTFTTPEGCSFDSIWIVDEYPQFPPTILDTLHCGETLIYSGNVYDSSGIYNIAYPGMGMFGCDSVAQINLTLSTIDAFIELKCEGDKFTLWPFTQNILPANSSVSWLWHKSGSLIYNGIPLYVSIEGLYTLSAIVTTNGEDCIFNIDTFSFYLDNYLPYAPNLNFTDTVICPQQGVTFQSIDVPGGGAQNYIWSAPMDVPIIQDGSNTAVFDFSNSTGGQVCVYAFNSCGLSPDVCSNVIVTPTILLDFSYSIDGLMVTFNSQSQPNTLYAWQFGDGNSGTGNNPKHTYIGEGKYSVQLISTGGCNQDTIFKQIAITSETIDPNETILLTPNGDNVNDILVIEGIEQYPDNELTIVNRWGDIVFKAKPYMNDWGGEGTNGGLLTQGTYYFILRNVGSDLPQGGNIVILK
jgi:gliding motility-associated-like protein